MRVLFKPYQIKDVVLPNRIVMPAMCQYSATTNGFVQDWHILHYGTRAVGGVGLIILEATAVEKGGRISEHDLGIWDDGHIEGLRKIVQVCHTYGAKVGIQIGHAGRKGCGPERVAPSAVPFSEGGPVPMELTVQEIAETVSLWKEAGRRAREAQFDVLQIHGAHGYLIHQFLSPISNHRTDSYGGSLENRMRFLLEIVEAVRQEWPANKPLSVRLSAVDYLPGGLTIEDTILIAQALKEKGVDLIDVSSGGIGPASIPLAPGYQVKYAEAVKKQVQISTIAVGLITSRELAQEIVFNERADLVALGRELLRNPYWVLHASSHSDKLWPKQYERARTT